MKYNANEFLGYSFNKLLKYYFQTNILIFKNYLKFILPNKKLLKSTLALKNSKKGKKVFVFGSGPSMNILDPIKISNYVINEGFEVIAVNSYMYSNFAKLVKPNFMVFSDPLDFIDVPDTHPRINRAIKGKEDKLMAIKNDIPLIVPIQFSEHTKKNHGKVYYFNDCPNYFSEKINLLKPRPYKSFTGMKAIASAIHMGYDEIYICGFDYDHFKKTTVNKDNQIVHEFAHFYESKDRPNHYVPVNRSFGHHLHDCALAFIQHDKFRNFNVINLNQNSLIDSFPKNDKLDIYIN